MRSVMSLAALEIGGNYGMIRAWMFLEPDALQHGRGQDVGMFWERRASSMDVCTWMF